MGQHEISQPDYGTGQKKLGMYLVGFISCSILTLISFWAVMAGNFSRLETITLIYVSALIQFFVQLVCFLRLNTQTEQGRYNVMSFVFTGVILISVVVGTIWIMWNLAYFMAN